ncbi:MAG: hypothetical protein Q9186_005263 [Xanthomendoza sp. 1 TL-2023]
MSASLTVIVFFLTLTLIHATPISLIRDDYFREDNPTCANDNRLSDTPARSAPLIKIQPDCNTVIDRICTAAINNNNLNATSIGSAQDTCKGRTFFTGFTKDWPKYAECVDKFQDIAKECMWDKSAGFQYGVFKVSRFATDEDGDGGGFCAGDGFEWVFFGAEGGVEGAAWWGGCE